MFFSTVYIRKLYAHATTNWAAEVSRANRFAYIIIRIICAYALHNIMRAHANNSAHARKYFFTPGLLFCASFFPVF